jgi:hypothetical protein
MKTKKIYLPAELIETAKELQKFDVDARMPNKFKMTEKEKAVFNLLTENGTKDNSFVLGLTAEKWTKGWSFGSGSMYYRLDPNVEILPELPMQEWWEEAGLIRCEIIRKNGVYRINYPDNLHGLYHGLPARPNEIDDYEFIGWAFEECFRCQGDIYSQPLIFWKEGTFYSHYADGSMPITARWTIWRKAGQK